MKTPLDRARPVVVTVEWRTGARTPEWERLWQRILSNTITKESQLKKEKPKPERVSDDV